MLDKLIVVTQQRVSLFAHKGGASVIREYLQGEESQEITVNPRESLTRVLDYVKKAQLLQGCNMVRVLYDEELHSDMLNSLVDFVKDKVQCYEVIQFKTILPVLLLKSVSTEMNSTFHVRLCDCVYRVDIDDSKLLISRQNDFESTTDFTWNDESLADLFRNDCYPSLNAYKIEELQGNVQKLEEEIGIKTKENRKLREDLKQTKQDLVQKTKTQVACLKELAAIKDKEEKVQERVVFRAYDIPRLVEYLPAMARPYWHSVRAPSGWLPLVFERIVDTEKLVALNQPIFRIIIDKGRYSKLGKSESILKASRSGRLFCFSSSLRNNKTTSLRALFSKLQEIEDLSYNPVLLVIADENDTEDEIRQWCYEQGYDIYV
ncbi:MAG: hypothetical protein WCR34_03885 [Bacilli bacterium]